MRVVKSRLSALAVVAAVLAAPAHGFSQYVYYWPTSPAVADAMMKLAGVGPGDVVYDLGSGDGRLVLLAAEKYGARGVGIEQDPALVRASLAAARQKNVADRVTFRQGDFFTSDIGDATVVMLYLTPSLNTMLEPKLRRDLRPGTRIVSNQFGIGSWVPDESIVPERGTELHLWRVPRRPARPPDVAFTPTPAAAIDVMLHLAHVTAADTVLDLGSGDGRIPILAAQKHGARGVGIEIDPALLDRARQVAAEGGVAERVSFIEGDLFDADFSSATVVTLFLSSAVNDRLQPALRALRPGTRIVSRQFGISGWPPDETRRGPDGIDVFLWTVRP